MKILCDESLKDAIRTCRDHNNLEVLIFVSKAYMVKYIAKDIVRETRNVRTAKICYGPTAYQIQFPKNSCITVAVPNPSRRGLRGNMILVDKAIPRDTIDRVIAPYELGYELSWE